MACMCAQTRPRFILSSERVWGNVARTHVNSKGKNPLPEALDLIAAEKRYFHQLQYTDTGPTSPRAHPIVPNRDGASLEKTPSCSSHRYDSNEKALKDSWVFRFRSRCRRTGSGRPKRLRVSTQ